MHAMLLVEAACYIIFHDLLTFMPYGRTIRRFMSMNRCNKYDNANNSLFSSPQVKTYNKRVLGMTAFFEALAIVLTASTLVNLQGCLGFDRDLR